MIHAAETEMVWANLGTAQQERWAANRAIPLSSSHLPRVLGFENLNGPHLAIVSSVR